MRILIPMHLTPVEYLTWVFGTASALAEFLNVSDQAVSQRRHVDGKVPVSWMEPILSHARSEGLDITAEDLILGRTVDESDYYE